MLIYIVANSFFLLFITAPIYEDQIKTRQEIIQNQFELVGDRIALQHLRIENQVNFIIEL